MPAFDVAWQCVRAIFHDAELPAGQAQFKQLKAELARHWPVICHRKQPPADAKKWEGKPHEVKLLERC
jgi:ferredoxin